jgi:predicted phage terminase large subunit-like protein
MTVWGVFSATMAEASSNFVGRSGKRESQRDREAMFDEAMRVKNMTAGMGGSDSTPRVMLMYAWQARLELHELVSKVEQTARRMKVDKLIIENKAAGHSVAQEIRRLYNNADFAVQLVDPKAQDKLARLYSVQHLFAEGMVHAPDHSWAQEVITQTSQFPKGKHDDLVDTVSMALRHMRELGMLTRQQERVTEMENMKRYTGKQPTPLYPV